MNTHFKDDPNRPLTEEELVELAGSGDAAEVLALVGDAALDLAIIHLIWDSSLSKTGRLTEKRQKVVSNRNLAKYCDEWGLYSCMLDRLKTTTEDDIKSKTITHEKGALVELILGVIYLKLGFTVLPWIVP